MQEHKSEVEEEGAEGKEGLVDQWSNGMTPPSRGGGSRFESWLVHIICLKCLYIQKVFISSKAQGLSGCRYST